MVDKSIAFKLSLYISVAVIFVFIAFIGTYFLFSHRIIRENIEYKAIGLSFEVSTKLCREFQSVKETNLNIAQHYNSLNPGVDVETLLKEVIEKHSYITSVYIYLDTTYALPFHYIEAIRNQNSIEFKWMERPGLTCEAEEMIFQQNIKREMPGWSSHYICNPDSQVFASYIQPIKGTTENKDIQGFISSRLSFKSLNELLMQFNGEKMGYAFVSDGQGYSLTDPAKVTASGLGFFSVSGSNKRLSTVNRREKKPDMQAIEDNWSYMYPVPETPWYVSFILPRHVLFNELYKISLRIILFALVSFAIIFALVSFIIKKQIAPISNLTSRLTLFSSPFKLNTKNEIKQMANSLEYLKIWFEQYQITREKEVMNNHQHKRDLQQASEIQQSLIKNLYPAFPERDDIDIFTLYKPAMVVSGDLFDYYFIDDSSLMFTIGDVSGKGIPAAIFMSVCQTLIKNNAHFKSPRKIVEKTNTELSTSNHHQFFLTLFVGILNIKTGELTFCNAAHTFPLIFKGNKSLIELKPTHGLPLGLYPKKEYSDDHIFIEPGDLILLYTDGVYDALNIKNINHGSIWFRKKLKNSKNNSPKEVIDLLYNDLNKKETPIRDDISMLGIQFKKKSLV